MNLEFENGHCWTMNETEVPRHWKSQRPYLATAEAKSELLRVLEHNRRLM